MCQTTLFSHQQATWKWEYAHTHTHTVCLPFYSRTWLMQLPSEPDGGWQAGNKMDVVIMTCELVWLTHRSPCATHCTRTYSSIWDVHMLQMSAAHGPRSAWEEILTDPTKLIKPSGLNDERDDLSSPLLASWFSITQFDVMKNRPDEASGRKGILCLFRAVSVGRNEL